MALQRSSSAPHINVTPLIDVLLVLLIIFMVISPKQPSSFDVRAPEKPPETDAISENDMVLLVTVEPTGGYKVNTTAVASLPELETLLHHALDGRPLDRKATFIKAPRGLRYDAVVRVIDVMKAAGAAPIGLQLDDLN